ncbi:MAG: C40 family peptidase, partial [Clostridia bacterium]|nr:C40 family peptidase [Clostridia bacterium]
KGWEGQTAADEEKAMQDLLDTMQPGDVLYYNFVTNNHVMLYVGNGIFWHCSSNGVAANYDYEMKVDRTEGRGSLYESTFDEYFGAHDIFDSVNKVCLYRPFNMGYEMSEQSILRTEKLQDLVIYKTTSAPEGVSVNPGDEVEIQIMIRSARDEDATVTITDVIPQGMEYVSGADSVENGVMNWTVTIPARETKTFKYVCRVKNDPSLIDTLIAWDQTKVEGVIINNTPVYVGVTLTEQEQNTLMEINYKDLTAKNDKDLVAEVYSKIGLTTNAQMAADYLSDLFPSYPGFSVMSEVTPVRDENTSTGISFVPNLYGGQNCNTLAVETGIRVRRMEEIYLIPGDIIVNSTTYSAENAELYIYLGDEVFVSASSGKVRKANADSLLDSMMGQFCFAVLRPSMCYAADTKSTALPEEYTGSDAVTVTFDLGGGMEKITVKVQKGKPISYIPARTGHTFVSWQLDGSNVAFPYTVYGGENFTAVWSTPELKTPVISTQPVDTSVALFERKGPTVKVDAMQGYSLRYQWYKTTKAESTGGTAIAGATAATGVVDTTSAKVGDTFYVYCVVTAVRNSDGKQTTVTSVPAKITIKAGDPNILFIGSGVLKRGGLNDMGEYLAAFYKAAGQNINIDYITKGSDYNIYETGLTGTEQSLVREKLEAKTYTAVIIQIGRDYALYTGSTKNKEMTAYKTIATMVEELSPGCQILLTFGPWRQDTTTNWFPRYEEQGIIGIEGHKEAILKYYEGTYAPLGGFKLIDTVIAFEKALAAGINPFGGTTDDYPGVEGSYLMAAYAYGQLTGKTPVGLNVFSSYPGVVTKENAEKLQQIASEMAGIAYTPTALDPSKEIGGSSTRPVDDGTFNVLVI